MVKKGEVICRLDESEYRELERVQLISVGQARADKRRTELDLNVATTALEEYRMGKVRLRTQELESQIALTKAQVVQMTDRLNWSVQMRERGYVAQTQVSNEEVALRRSVFTLAGLQREFENFQRYELPKTSLDLQEPDRVRAVEPGLSNGAITRWGRPAGPVPEAGGLVHDPGAARRAPELRPQTEAGRDDRGRHEGPPATGAVLPSRPVAHGSSGAAPRDGGQPGASGDACPRSPGGIGRGPGGDALRDQSHARGQPQRRDQQQRQELCRHRPAGHQVRVFAPGADCRGGDHHGLAWGAPWSSRPSPSSARTAWMYATSWVRHGFERRSVTLGRSTAEWLEVTTGLAEGEEVVLPGSFPGTSPTEPQASGQSQESSRDVGQNDDQPGNDRTDVTRGEWTTAPYFESRPRRRRVALYSHDTMGLGHMRRNLLIAQTLVRSPSPPVVLMASGARESGRLPLPPGVDCLHPARVEQGPAGTLPGPRPRPVPAGVDQPQVQGPRRRAGGLRARRSDRQQGSPRCFRRARADARAG